MSSRRALRSTVDADLNSPLKSEPRKRSTRKKTPAVNDALASSVEAALEGQTPPSIQSEAESEMQATAESRSTSPTTTSQPMRRRLRSASRELSPPDMQSAAPPKATRGRNARASSSSATKQRTTQSSTRGGSSRGRGRGKKAAPSSRNNNKNGKRPADEITDQSADETDNDNNSRASKRARSEQYSGDDDRTSVASTEADEHDSSIYHTPQAERAQLPFSPIPEVEEPETPMGAVGATSRSNEEQQFVAQSSRESITMSAREGSLEIIEHTQEVNVRQPSMEVMQSTETNEDVAHDAEDMEMSDVEALSDSSDLAGSPSAQLVPQSAQNEQQEVDNSEEEESSDASTEPEVSEVNTTMVAGPSASATNDQTTSPNVDSVATAQPTSSTTPKAESSSFLSRFNIFRSAQKVAQPDRAQSEGAQSPELNLNTHVGVQTVTPQRPTSPTPARAPATVASTYQVLNAIGIGPGMYNRRLAAYRPGQLSQPVEPEVDEDAEDSEDEYTRRYDEYELQGKKARPITTKPDFSLFKENFKLRNANEEFKQEKKQTARTIKQMEQTELKALGKKRVAEWEAQQIASASKTNNTELLSNETGPVGTSHDTAAAVPAIDTATHPPTHLTSNSPADVPAMSTAINLRAGDQQVNTGASPINTSFVDENMEVDDTVDVAQPLTPTPATEPSKKGFWSAATGKIKSLVTPFVFGDRSQTAANAALANNTEADTPQFTYEQSIHLDNTPTRPRGQRRTGPAGQRKQSAQPRQQTTFTSHQKRPEPKRISKSHTPSKNAGTSRFRRQNESVEKPLTLEEAEKAEKARLAKVREKLDNMTTEEKAAHELKTIEMENKMRDHQARYGAALAESENRKRGNQTAFGADDESLGRSPSKKVLIKKNEGQYKFPSLDEYNELGELVDEEEKAEAAAKAKSLAKGKSPMRPMSATPLSSGGSPMSIDSPPAILSQDLPAELQHPINRAPDALYYRQVELIQARMTDAEREEDDNLRVSDFGLWKICRKVWGSLTDDEDLVTWEAHCASVRKIDYWGAGGTEEGLQSQKQGFLVTKKLERQERQLADIERRKKLLSAEDPNNIFLKAQQQEEAQAVDPDEDNVAGTFAVPDTFIDDDDDDEEEDSDTATKDPQQSVDDQAANTPPPPPRPGNAQLPQQSAGVGIGMSSYLKHVPAVPSKLRHVEEMSPLQIKEKERRESEGVQDKENKAPGPLEQSFRDWVAPYMNGDGVPGGWKEEYYYGEEDVVKDLTDAYDQMNQMEF